MLRTDQPIALLRFTSLRGAFLARELSLTEVSNGNRQIGTTLENMCLCVLGAASELELAVLGFLRKLKSLVRGTGWLASPSNHLSVEIIDER